MDAKDQLLEHFDKIALGIAGLIVCVALLGSLLGGSEAEGHKAKVTMMFRGRQVTHPELGLEVLKKVTADLEDLAKVEQHPSFEGRQMSMVVSPLKAKT